MHKDFLEPISDDHHQAVIVPAYIKDRIGRNVIRRVEKLTNVIEIPEVDMFQN